MRFVFGYDAKANLVQAAEGQPEDLYHELVAKTERQIATRPRTRPTNVKDDIVRQRGYKTIRPKKEQVVEFSYRPRACKKDYRVVALRKNLSIERGDNVLFDEYRYFFYITNDRKLTADQVIGEAHQRCNQENLIANLKSGVRALHAPVNTLYAILFGAGFSRPSSPRACRLERNEEEVRMSVIVIIAIVVVVLIVLALVVIYIRRRAEQRRVLRARQAVEATAHRQEADAHASRAQALAPEADALRRKANEQAVVAETEAARAKDLETRATQAEQQISREGQSAARHDEKAAGLEEQL